MAGGATTIFSDTLSGDGGSWITYCGRMIIPTSKLLAAPGTTKIKVTFHAMVVTANQVTTPALIDIGITDANATVSAGNVPIPVQAPGAGDVEVWTHHTMATRLTSGSNGMFTGNLDLSAEPPGPIHVMFQAWDVTPPATPAVHLVGELTLFVQGTRGSIPTPAQQLQ